MAVNRVFGESRFRHQVFSQNPLGPRLFDKRADLCELALSFSLDLFDVPRDAPGNRVNLDLEVLEDRPLVLRDAHTGDLVYPFALLPHHHEVVLTSTRSPELTGVLSQLRTLRA